MMLQRNLLYTAVTRAKKLVVLVGSRKAHRPGGAHGLGGAGAVPRWTTDCGRSDSARVATRWSKKCRPGLPERVAKRGRMSRLAALSAANRPNGRPRVHSPEPSGGW